MVKQPLRVAEIIEQQSTDLDRELQDAMRQARQRLAARNPQYDGFVHIEVPLVKKVACWWGTKNVITTKPLYAWSADIAFDPYDNLCGALGISQANAAMIVRYRRLYKPQLIFCIDADDNMSIRCRVKTSFSDIAKELRSYAGLPLHSEHLTMPTRRRVLNALQSL